MEKLVKLEGHEVGLKASAGTVRSYRNMFGADLIVDMGKVEEDIIKNKNMSQESTGIAENVVYVMAKEYNPDIPEIEVWLDQFSPYFVFSAIVQVINMWHENTKTLNKTRKK